MTFGDYIAIAFIVISTVITFAGFWLVASAVWPKKVERCRQLCSRGVLKSFLIGVIPFAVGVIICIQLAQIPVQALGLVLLAVFLFFCHVGVAGFAAHIGQKLSPVETDLWVRNRRGGGALAATFLIPVVGWVFMFLVVSALGCGAILRAFFSKNDPVIASGEKESSQPPSSAEDSKIAA